MPRILSITISAEHVDRIKKMFHKILGRDLTPEEERYLGISPASSTDPATAKDEKSNP